MCRSMLSTFLRWKSLYKVCDLGVIIPPEIVPVLLPTSLTPPSASKSHSEKPSPDTSHPEKPAVTLAGGTLRPKR